MGILLRRMHYRMAGRANQLLSVLLCALLALCRNEVVVERVLSCIRFSCTSPSVLV
ncbi:hypothetical protein BC2230_10230 [Burkholderia cepacia]